MAQTVQWLIVGLIVAMAARQVWRQMRPARARLPSRTIAIRAEGAPAPGGCARCDGCGGCPTKP